MLIKLLWLRLRGGFRQRLCEMKTLRGFIFLALTLALIILMIKYSTLPNSQLTRLIMDYTEQRQRQVGQFLPIGLLGAFLLTVFIAPRPVLSFSPSEINLLFCGPFTRRALLLYKISFYVFGVFLSSVFITLLKMSFSSTTISTFFGIFLTLLFMQLLTITTDLLLQWLGNYRRMRVRFKYLSITLIFLFASIGWYCLEAFNSPTLAINQFQLSSVGTVLLAPFEVFSHIFLSQSVFPELLYWSMLGLAINIALLVAIILLDNQCYEASTMANIELHQRRDQTRRRGLLFGKNIVKVRSFMPFPVLGGIGPIAWRQMLATVRISSKALCVYLAIAIFAGPMLVEASEKIPTIPLFSSIFFVAIFMLPKTFIFDFRRDLDAMENFKALPLPAWKISIGQLSAVVLFSSLIELALLASTAVFLSSKWYVLLIGAGLFLMPFNLLLYALENFFFLLFPAPLVPVGRADFEFIGRTLVGFAINSTILVASCLMAAIVGLKSGLIMGWPWPAMMIVAWFALTLIALLTIPLLSWAFKRFDVSLSNKSNL